MKYIFLLIIVLSCKSNHSTIKKQFQQCYQMIGTWQSFSNDEQSIERWVLQNDSTMIGENWTINQEDTIFHEQIQLAIRNGKILYQPIVDDQNNGHQVSFELKNFSKTSVEFENKLHDFPQNITYFFKSSDSLLASISGKKNNQFKSFEWSKHKTK